MIRSGLYADVNDLWSEIQRMGIPEDDFLHLDLHDYDVEIPEGNFVEREYHDRHEEREMLRGKRSPAQETMDIVSRLWELEHGKKS